VWVILDDADGRRKENRGYLKDCNTAVFFVKRPSEDTDGRDRGFVILPNATHRVPSKYVSLIPSPVLRLKVAFFDFSSNSFHQSYYALPRSEANYYPVNDTLLESDLSKKVRSKEGNEDQKEKHVSDGDFDENEDKDSDKFDFESSDDFDEIDESEATEEAMPFHAPSSSSSTPLVEAEVALHSPPSLSPRSSHDERTLTNNLFSPSKVPPIEVGSSPSTPSATSTSSSTGSLFTPTAPSIWSPATPLQIVQIIPTETFIDYILQTKNHLSDKIESINRLIEDLERKKEATRIALERVLVKPNEKEEKENMLRGCRAKRVNVQNKFASDMKPIKADIDLTDDHTAFKVAAELEMAAKEMRAGISAIAEEEKALIEQIQLLEKEAKERIEAFQNEKEELAVELAAEEKELRRLNCMLDRYRATLQTFLKPFYDDRNDDSDADSDGDSSVA